MNDQQNLLRCGFGRQDITPPLGTPLVGYYRPRFSKGVIDPLFIRAAFFESESGFGLLMTVDVCLMSKELTNEIRRAIVEELNLPTDSIFVTCSHTHTGPLTGKDFASDLHIDPAYLEDMKKKAVKAAKEAQDSLVPARLFYAKTQAKGISFVRRFRMKDGSVKTNAGNKNGEIDHALGEPNEDLRLLKILREGAEDLYLVNFGTHADTVSGEYVSADYPGYVCSILEGAIPESRCMFLLGPQGDVNHVNRFDLPNYGKVISERAAEDYRETAAHARYMGRVIAGQILSVCDRAEEVPAGEVSFGEAEVHLPANRDATGLEEAKRINDLYMSGRKNEIETNGRSKTEVISEARRIVRMQSAPEFYPFSVYAMKIGEFVFAGLPGEPFTEIGTRIYKNSPFQKMILCCLTNASCGYVGTGRAYDEGGYETRTSSYKRGADDVLVEGMNRLLQEMK